MGDQRRADQDREQKRDTDHDVRKAGDADLDHDEHASFDGTHANLQNAQMRKYAWGMTDEASPARTIAGVGDQDKLFDRFEAAVEAKAAAQIHALVTDMDGAHRARAAARLTDLATFLPAHEIAYVGDSGLASLNAIVQAMCASSSSVREMRAYLANVHPTLIWHSMSGDTVAALRARFPKTAPYDVFPQLTDADGFTASSENGLIVRWYIEVTPLAVVAREMLSANEDGARFRAWGLNNIGPSAWKWLDAVTPAMIAAGTRGILAIYREELGDQVKEPTPREGQTAEQLSTEYQAAADKAAGVQAAGTGFKRTRSKADLLAHKTELLASATVEDIELQTKLAGLSEHEQLEWVLDKPGVTIEEVRKITMLWSRNTPGLGNPAVVKRIHALFPAARPTDLYGVVPDELYSLALRDAATRRWLTQDAEPADVLRFVMHDSTRTADACRLLVADGVGYKWVYGLGGHYDDMLLRKFALRCPDPKVVEYVNTRVLGTAAEAIGVDTTVKAVPRDAYADNRAHFEEDVNAKANHQIWGAGPKTISDDVDQLATKDVEEVHGDRAKLQKVLEQSNDATIARVADRLKPSIHDAVLYAPSIPASVLAGWVIARPRNELVDLLIDPVTAKKVRAAYPLGPLELMPPLKEAFVLRAVLGHNPDVLDWMFERSHPLAVIAAIGDERIADVVLAAMDGATERIEMLPPGESLPVGARTALQNLAKHAKGPVRVAIDAKLGQKKGADADLKDAEREVHSADGAARLGDAGLSTALHEAIEQKRTPETLVAICRAHGSSGGLVQNVEIGEQLVELTKLSPTLLFPTTPLPSLLRSAGLRRPTLNMAPAFEILHASADAGTMSALAGALDAGAGRVWFDALPHGRALSATERELVHRLAQNVSPQRARQLFEVRFNTPISGFQGAELDHIWGLLERVPEAHITERTVSQIIGAALPPTSGGAGVYFPEDQSIVVGEGLGKRNTSEYDRFGNTARMTEAQAIDALGSKEILTKFVHDHRLTFDPKTQTYAFAEQKPNMLTVTMLHEIGHSVDAGIGGHTELVYGLAGWKTYPESEFDQWATELGGWSSVTAPDKVKIREAWMSWMSSAGAADSAPPIGVGELVPTDHPAVAARYANVGVVKLARNNTKTTSKSPAPFGDRAAICDHQRQRFMTVSMRAVHVAPSAYALSAPGEYFAECYAHYYREFDGTPATADTKGASLAPWIKDWFDKNIDTLDHMPRR
jgi:hypothetical protein